MNEAKNTTDSASLWGAKQRLDNLDIIRALSIIIVVAFHGYGMMYTHFNDATNQMYSDIYEPFNQSVLICIAMPMFIFVSGYLFSYLLGLGKYKTWSELVRKKAQRILLPFLVFSWIFMATTGNWHPLEPIIQGTYWHLWFLPMLFWCFIIYYGIHRAGLSNRLWFTIPLLILSLFGVSAPKFVPMYIGLQYIHKWFFWFYLGGMICQYKDIITAALTKYNSFLLLIAAYFAYALIDIREYGDDTWYATLGNASMVVALWYLSTLVDWTKLKISTYIISFSTYSFGIYIFHNWVEHQLLSNTSKRILHLDEIAATHEILFPLCFFLVALFISWFLTKLLMMTKVGKYLIG